MAIPMKQIPSNLLVPGMYQEPDNSQAGEVTDIKKVLVIGYKTAESPAEAGVPVQVLTTAQAGRLCGFGSPAAIMAEAFLAINKTEQLWLLPIEQPAGGVKWSEPFTVEVNNPGSGSIEITINGKTFFAAVTAGQTAAQVASAIVARINSEDNIAVEAEINTGNPATFKVSSIVSGIIGNNNTVSISSDVVGITITKETVITGSGVTNITSVLKNLGGKRYNYFISSFNDPQNITALSDELESRYSALRQIGGRAYIPLSGDVGSITEAGSILAQAEAVNSPHILLIPCLDNPQLPYEWAARFAAATVRILADDPAANTYEVEVKGLTAKKEIDFDARQKLLEAGVTTWRLDPVGNVLVERLVTSYTENTDGGRDTSYLDVQVTETVDAIRTYINSIAKSRFKSWKLASTEENFGKGSKVMTSGVWRSFLADLYQSVFIQDKQWCQDFEYYKNSIFVEIKKDNKTRLEYKHEPVLIGQFLIGAGLFQFK